MKTSKNKIIHWFIIFSFVSLYLLVSIISMIHVIDFFELSNNSTLAISLALAFEIGAAASLASVIVLEKMNKTIVWGLFAILTLMQMMGNTYFTFVNLHDYQGWIDLFALNEMEPLAQKRILAIVSGAILPIVALGFIKALIDYIKPSKEGDKPILDRGNSQVLSDNEDEFLSNEKSDEIPFQKEYHLDEKEPNKSPDIETIKGDDNPDIKSEEVIKREPVIIKENKSTPEPKVEKKTEARKPVRPTTPSTPKTEHKPVEKIATKEETEKALENVDKADPAFQKMVEEYINKTKKKGPQ